MRQLLLIIFFLTSVMAFAGNGDRIYFHNGTLVNGEVVRISAFTIEYKNSGEQVIRTASRHAVEKIELGGAQKTEIISPKITINSEADWEKVVILEDNSEINALSRKDQVFASASNALRTAEGRDEKADEFLKKEAARKGCPFVLIRSQVAINEIWLAKKGVGYTY